jgi:hypothetical protein
MIYQIKVTLQGAKPPIWRRLEILHDTKLEDLHKIIQTTMGWMNGHLHHFIVGHDYYNPPSEHDDFGINYTGIKVNRFLRSVGNRIQYEYDFGDSWLHIIELEEIKKKEKDINYPRCIKGKRACPPEDCGGIWGYMELVDIMKNPKHPEYEEMSEWLGRELEPEKFEIDIINERLGRENYGTFVFPF